MTQCRLTCFFGVACCLLPLACSASESRCRLEDASVERTTERVSCAVTSSCPGGDVEVVCEDDGDRAACTCSGSSERMGFHTQSGVCGRWDFENHNAPLLVDACRGGDVVFPADGLRPIDCTVETDEPLCACADFDLFVAHRGDLPLMQNIASALTENDEWIVDFEIAAAPEPGAEALAEWSDGAVTAEAAVEWLDGDRLLRVLLPRPRRTVAVRVIGEGWTTSAACVP